MFVAVLGVPAFVCTILLGLMHRLAHEGAMIEAKALRPTNV